ncbi:MAG: hypothetical protein JW936_10560 [Sedimentisphaerales bacterium]|nr:hypothetical protein [Sedimentisphaerales bacterium]
MDIIILRKPNGRNVVVNMSLVWKMEDNYLADQPGTGATILYTVKGEIEVLESQQEIYEIYRRANPSAELMTRVDDDKGPLPAVKLGQGDFERVWPSRSLAAAANGEPY